MALTPEQIAAYRQKYNLDNQGTASSTPGLKGSALLSDLKKNSKNAQNTPQVIPKKDNNILQDIFVNTVGRPAIRAGQALVGAGVKAFGSEDQKKKFAEESQKPVNLPLGLGQVQGQKAFGEGGGKQLALDTGKTALDIATIGTGGAVNEGIANGVSKVVEPIAKKLPGKVLPYLATKVPGVAANAIEAGLYNTGYNVLNEKPATENLKTAIGVGVIAPPLIGGIVKGAGKVAEGMSAIANPEKIMQRVARISKGKQQKFEQTAGESIGEYLNKRKIYGNEEQITSQLYKRFQESKNIADEALAELPGLHKPEIAKTALTELADREAKISAPGAVSKDFNRVNELLNKVDGEGLTMSELNEVKRLYENNVKLDYVRDNVATGIARANNIDDNLRAWQFKTADELGLKNLGAINRETRLARQLADDIGAEYSGQAGNNAMTLTDWIMLSGGDPTSIAGFLAKKTFSSKRLQSAVAKNLSKEPDMGMVFAKKKPQLALPAPKSGTVKVKMNTGETIPVLPKGKTVEPTMKTPSAGSYVPTNKPKNYPSQAASETTATKSIKKPITKSVPPKETSVKGVLPKNNGIKSNEFLKDKRNKFGEVLFDKQDEVFKAIPDGTMDTKGMVVKKGNAIFPTNKLNKDILDRSYIELNSDGSIKEGVMYNKSMFLKDIDLDKIFTSKILPKKNEGKISREAALTGAGIAGGIALGTGIAKAVDKIFNKTETYYTKPIDGEGSIKEKTPTEKIKQMIKYTESRGEKDPYSFSQPSGYKAMGKALGAYQITEGELKTYAKKYLGKVVTAKEFLSSPKLQDEYITKKIETLKKRGLTLEEILAVHNKGASDLTKEGLEKAKKKANEYIKTAMAAEI